MKISNVTLSVKHTEDFMTYLCPIYLDINHKNIVTNRLKNINNLILKVTNTSGLSVCYILFVVFTFLLLRQKDSSWSC